jgi:hypothetical protein
MFGNFIFRLSTKNAYMNPCAPPHFVLGRGACHQPVLQLECCSIFTLLAKQRKVCSLGKERGLQANGVTPSWSVQCLESDNFFHPTLDMFCAL